MVASRRACIGPTYNRLRPSCSEHLHDASLDAAECNQDCEKNLSPCNKIDALLPKIQDKTTCSGGGRKALGCFVSSSLWASPLRHPPLREACRWHTTPATAAKGTKLSKAKAQPSSIGLDDAGGHESSALA